MSYLNILNWTRIVFLSLQLLLTLKVKLILILLLLLGTDRLLCRRGWGWGGGFRGGVYNFQNYLKEGGVHFYSQYLGGGGASTFLSDLCFPKIGVKWQTFPFLELEIVVVASWEISRNHTYLRSLLKTPCWIPCNQALPGTCTQDLQPTHSPVFEPRTLWQH